MRQPLGFFRVIVLGIGLNLMLFSVFIPGTCSANNEQIHLGQIPLEQTGQGFRNQASANGDIPDDGQKPFDVQLLFPGFFAFLALAAILVMALWFKRDAFQTKKEKTTYKKNMEKMRILVENSDDGILIIEKLKFVYANKKVYEIMGLAHAQKVSDNLVDFVHPDDLGIVLENYEKSMLSKGEEINFEVRILRPDKTIVWLHNRFVPTVWDGKPVNLAFLRDVTSKKMMEKDLHQAQRMEAIGALSGGIAHEFNNILTSILGSAEVALMDLDEYDFGKKEFERIRESGHRASHLVRQILTLTREHSLNVEPLYLSPIIKEALKLLRTTLASNIRISEHIDKTLGLVKADSIEMYQVFMNLCTNAKHAMEYVESPRLDVEMKNEFFSTDHPRIAEGLRPGNYVTIRVKDNGTGISPENQKKIFEPYFSTKKKGIGTGLGLTTTLGIVKKYEGFISFQTEEGKGSCFVVYLPVFEKQKGRMFHLEKESGPSVEGKILFVDDEKEITIIAKKMLENMGFSVMTANSGKEALQYFSMSPDTFDALVTDLAMPEMTGEVLVKEVMKIRPGFPVVMCTGHSDTFDEQKARSFGVVEYVSKPYNLKELSLIVSKYIRKGIAA